jgi:aminoglycoside/choline kinase family phosphotransferase
MASPPEKEQNRQFEILSGIFTRAGIPVTRILKSQPAAGWYLLEDRGTNDLEAAYAGPDRDSAIGAAIDCLIRLQMVNDPSIPPYTAERFADELGIFREWFVEKTLRTTVPEDVEAVFLTLVDRAVSQPQCCIHRDYHCRNLLFDGTRLGVVDFQDALVGPASYDLASLLHDCYYEFSADEVARWIDYYLSATPLIIKSKTFARDLDYVAVQRQLKAVGIFARLKLRDGKSSHLEYIEPVLARIQRQAAGRKPLAPIAQWLDTIDITAAVDSLQTETGS